MSEMFASSMENVVVLMVKFIDDGMLSSKSKYHAVKLNIVVFVPVNGVIVALMMKGAYKLTSTTEREFISVVVQ